MAKYLKIALTLLLTGTLTLLLTPATPQVMRYLIGNPVDVNPTLAGPVYNLGGGGPDVDEAIQWMINKVSGCTDCSTKVDVVVIRSSGDDAYNQPMYGMRGVDSVETLLITNNSKPTNLIQSTKSRMLKSYFLLVVTSVNTCNFSKVPS